MNPAKIAYFGIAVTIDDKPYHVTLEYVANKSLNYRYTLFRRYPLGVKTLVYCDCFGTYSNTNAGYHVMLDDIASPLFAERIPHITTEVTNGGKAVDTWKAFADMSSPTITRKTLMLVGTIGYFTHDGKFFTE